MNLFQYDSKTNHLLFVVRVQYNIIIYSDGNGRRHASRLRGGGGQDGHRYRN